MLHESLARRATTLRNQHACYRSTTLCDDAFDLRPRRKLTSTPAASGPSFGVIEAARPNPRPDVTSLKAASHGLGAASRKTPVVVDSANQSVK